MATIHSSHDSTNAGRRSSVDSTRSETSPREAGADSGDRAHRSYTGIYSITNAHLLELLKDNPGTHFVVML